MSSKEDNEFFEVFNDEMENWIVPRTDPVVSYGFRFFGQKMSVDLGLVNVLCKEAIFPGAPYIDFVFKF